MRRSIMIAALTMALSAGCVSLASAQNTGGSGSGNAGGQSDTGGTTGTMTTNPESKSDDAAGTRGPASSPAVATPSGLESGAGHGCAAAELWDPVKKSCVPQ
jgi:hypothetical protein